MDPEPILATIQEGDDMDVKKVNMLIDGKIKAVSAVDYDKV